MFTSGDIRATMQEFAAERANLTAQSIEQARTKRNNAYDTLQQWEQEARTIGYARLDSYQQHALNAAKEAYRLADAEFQKVNNDPVARFLVAQHRTNTQAAEQQHKREAEQAALAQEQEAIAKEAHRSRYLAVGGTSAQFEAAWPQIWARELEARAAQPSQVERYTAQMRASGRYAF